MKQVSVVSCASYDTDRVRGALRELLAPIGGLDWVTPGMRVAIKANLVSMMKPDAAATTHPALLCALVEMLIARGASVVIGDSPGGLYNAAAVNRIYAATGMKEAERTGAVLNKNFLDEADAIINFCKLKTHGMMGMSAAAKNIFGVIPGTFKPEYHFRFPNHTDFATMILDLNTYFSSKTKLCIADAVVGMEGNGPTQGTPRKIGALLASASPHALDLAAAHLIGLGINDVPTLQVAHEKGLIPKSAAELDIVGDLSLHTVSDFKNIHVRRSLQFEGHGKFAAMFVRSALRATPSPKKRLCIGCKKCAEICPARAIVIKVNVPVINYKTCITCFCCQEFCPVGAMKVHRPLIARIVNHTK